MATMPDDSSPLEIVFRHQNTLPVDVEAIARDLGLSVQYHPLGRTIAGQLIRDARKGGRSGFLVIVNSDDHPNRRRFTLAHEIAHFILHRDLIDTGIIDDTFYRSDMSSYHEVQANRLAADILMPANHVKRLKLTTDAQAMSKQFGVSQQAMEIRLKST